MKSLITHIGTDYPVLLFFALLLWRIRKSDGDRSSLVAQEDGVSLRGMAAIMVLLHHLAPSTEHGMLMPKVFAMGTGGLAVALFFFLSGYGLQKQYLKKGESYRQSFLKKRIPTILIPFIMFTVLYWLVYFSLGRVITVSYILSDLRQGIPFVAYSWYLMALLFFYLFFWILMTVFRERVQWMPFFACGWYLLYAFICIKLKFLIYWYDTAHLIPLGMFCAVYEWQILKMLKNRYFYAALVVTVCFGWLISPHVYTAYANEHGMSIQLYYLTSLSRVFFFTALVVLLHQKIRIGNPVLQYLGKISLETYLIHGLIFYLLRGDYCDLKNEPLYCFLSLTGVILIASILYPLDRFLLRSWKRATKRQR